MVNIVGFSRGGTHLFWCFVSSHSQLQIPKVEINDLVGIRRLGFKKKLNLELRCLLGKYSFHFEGMDPKEVQKAVCSWYPNSLFRILRRHDPTKYISNTSLSKAKTIFLVKSEAAQVASWMRRGAKKNIAVKAYQEHLARWKQYSLSHESIFVNYQEFCDDPIMITQDIWKWLGVPNQDFPNEIQIKPKAHKNNPSGLQANSEHRTWETAKTEEIISSLKLDGKLSEK